MKEKLQLRQTFAFFKYKVGKNKNFNKAKIELVKIYLLAKI